MGLKLIDALPALPVQVHAINMKRGLSNLDTSKIYQIHHKRVKVQANRTWIQNRIIVYCNSTMHAFAVLYAKVHTVHV